MGILTKLSIEKINELIQNTNIEFVSLQETKNGITDSTYIGISKDNTKYIFKIFETSSKEDIETEIHILDALKELNVPKVISKEIVLFDNKPTIVLSFLDGKISKDISIKQIEEISLFIKKLHSIKTIRPQNTNIYKITYFQNMLSMVITEDKEEFEERVQLIKNINLDDNAIIHGDLFFDNAKFIDDNLSGVYDFGQSCYGNSYFDLAVMLISWCFKDDKFNLDLFEKALITYDESLTKDKIKPYMMYACLYYSLQRYTRTNKAKDYKELFAKFDLIKKI